MSASSERDIDAMTDEWGEQENDAIEREMNAQQQSDAPAPAPDKATAPALAALVESPRWVRYVAHHCMATLTDVDPIASGARCQFCGLLMLAPQSTYQVWRSLPSGDVFCRVQETIESEMLKGDVTSHALKGVFIHGNAFNFGYAGSGPADLALSILADFFGETPSKEQLWHGDAQCVQYHQAFKFRWVAPRRGIDAFSISSLEIAAWLASESTQR